MKTEIEWISTDEQLPAEGSHIIALAPHMGLFKGQENMELIECKVHKNGYTLLGYERDELLLEVEHLMWWAPCPGWMESPGWRVS